VALAINEEDKEFDEECVSDTSLLITVSAGIVTIDANALQCDWSISPSKNSSEPQATRGFLTLKQRLPKFA
jgi:hypothetical protein